MPPRPSGELEGWPLDRLDELPDGPWLVAHARPRQEKLLSSVVRRLGTPCLLFLEQRSHTYVGKGVQVNHVPLMPGYVFVPGDSATVRDSLYESGRLVRILPVAHGGALRNDLIDLARLITRSAGPLLVRPEIVAGRRVRLTRGSLAGLVGVVVRRRGHLHLVVNVHTLGTSVAVTCAAEDAELPEEIEA